MPFVRRRNPVIPAGNRLFECDRCGFEHHLRDTVIQNGLRIGKDSCLDEIVTSRVYGVGK